MGFMDWLTGGKKNERVERSFSSLEEVIGELRKREKAFLEDAGELEKEKDEILGEIRRLHGALAERVRKDKEKPFLNILIQNEKRVDEAFKECEGMGKDYTEIRIKMANLEKAKLALQHATPKEAQMFWDFPDERRAISQKIHELSGFQKRFAKFLDSHQDQKIFVRILSRRWKLEELEKNIQVERDRKMFLDQESIGLKETMDNKNKELEMEKERLENCKKEQDQRKKDFIIEEASLESSLGILFSDSIKPLKALMYDLGERELMENLARLERGRYFEEDVNKLMAFLEGVKKSPEVPRAFGQASKLLERRQEIEERFEMIKKHKEKAIQMENEKSGFMRETDKVRVLEHETEEKKNSRKKNLHELERVHSETANLKRKRNELENEIIELLEEYGWKITEDNKK